jgi:flavin-dependent dehydrogenase
MQPDVFVIGGGPAGLAAAIASRHKGFKVTLADSRQPPIDKACGEALLPEAAAALRALGIDPRTTDSAALRGVRFSGDGVSVASLFPRGAGWGIRRPVLHAALVREAENCGVELRWTHPVVDLDAVRARWIVGADGASSRVRAWAGLESFTRNNWRFGFRRHYRIAPRTDLIDIFWSNAAQGSPAQIYITPIASDEVGVAVLSRDPKFRVDDAINRLPELLGIFRNSPEVSTERGAITASRKLKRVARGNVALVGDASGSVDAITADGLSLSFRQALSLADAMARSDLSRYQTEHARMERRPRFMAEFMLAMDRRPWLRRRALHAMAARPTLFDGLLAMHVGESRPSEFAATCAALGLRMLG